MRGDGERERYREGMGSERDIERGGERERYREGVGSERDIEKGWGAREI